MSNSLKVSLQTTIYSLDDRGWSRRRIARELGIDRETVGRYLRLAKPAISTTGLEEAGETKPATSTTGLEEVGEQNQPFRPPGLKKSVKQNQPFRPPGLKKLVLGERVSASPWPQ
jgi:Homeodomain-like domain